VAAMTTAPDILRLYLAADEPPAAAKAARIAAEAALQPTLPDPG
jgi:hypothetical protein